MEKAKVEICVPVKIANTPTRVFASASGPSAQPDLMFMQSILVSTGENKNDDVFLCDELWKARSTPAYKPVDWEHNVGRELSPEELAENPGKVVVDNQTIGVMYNAYVIDDEQNVIDESRTSAADFEIPENFHIVDEAVIWKSLYPQTAARIEKGAREGTLFVSMETWFTDYDYLVGNKVVARNEETAFLDKSLRANGGLGTYGTSRVKRVLRNLTFGGKGIVARPANEPSVITSVSHQPMCAAASENEAIRRNVLFGITKTRASEPRKDLEMSTEGKTGDIAPTVPLEQFTKAHDEAVELRADVKAKAGEIAQAGERIQSLEGQIENLTSAFKTGAAKLDEVLPGFSSRVTSGNPENFFGTLAEVLAEDQAAKSELNDKFAAALEKIAQIEADNRLAARAAKLEGILAKSVADETQRAATKEKLLASSDKLSDEEFVTFAETLETLAPAAPVVAEMYGDEDEDIKKNKKDKEKAGKTKASQVAEILDIDEQIADSLIKSLAGEEQGSEDDLADVLNSVASEQQPSAGADGHQPPNLEDAFSGLVSAMLKPQGNE